MTATLEPAISSLSCPPRWGTPRTSSRATYGDRVAAIAADLGTPLLPWQRYVADVALEVDPGTGLLAYREVVVEIPRQSGKTTLGLSVRAHRAVGFGRPQTLLYTAQTRNDARQKWEDEHWPMLRDSSLGPLVTARKRTGAEAFVWSNGSVDGLPAPTAKAGHGKSLDLGFIDEAFAQVDDRLEQAFRPAMITRPQPQLWVVSTAGTAASTYLRAKVDAGRRRIEAGTRSQTAYFEWSAPDDADPQDPATWWACMPALGHTITEAAIGAELETMLSEHGADGLGLFRRAYLNQWPDAYGVGWHVIGERAWQARGETSERPGGDVAFAVDAAWPDAEFGSIAVAGRIGDEVAVQLVERRPGAGWIAERLRELVDRHDPVAVVLDKRGPAGHLLGELDRAGLDVVSPPMDEVARAAGLFHASVVGDAPYLRHYDQPELAAALGAVRKRPLGDAWTWARRGEVDISPLTAATLALWGLSGQALVPMFGFV